MCAEWPGACNRNGYGRVSRLGKVWLAHRLAWTVENGPIPVGLFVLHRCDNEPCVRVAHLYVGTLSDNQRDRERAGWQPHWGFRVDLDRVLELRAAGLSERKIAAELGVSRSGVSHALRRLADRPTLHAA